MTATETEGAGNHPLARLTAPSLTARACADRAAARPGSSPASSEGDGRPLVYAEQCGTCIYRPGNPMHLRPGALKDFTDSNLQADAVLICHQTTYGQQPQEVVCRGFMDRYAHRVNVVRVMDRLAALYGYDGGFREVSVPARSPYRPPTVLKAIRWAERRSRVPSDCRLGIQPSELGTGGAPIPPPVPSPPGRGGTGGAVPARLRHR